MEILMVVARVAAAIFTILFPMRMAIRRVSGLAFTFLRALAQAFFCLMKLSTLCCAMLENAVSLAEKNIEHRMRAMKIPIDKGSMDMC